MKRLLSLALCLVMVLGLFTGVVSAAPGDHKLIYYYYNGGEEYGPTVTTWVTGTISFRLAIQNGDSEPIPLPADADITFLTGTGTAEAGTITYEKTEGGITYWTWNADGCLPGKSATLAATVTVNDEEITYICDKSFTTEAPPLSLYAEASCETYLTNHQMPILYSGDNTAAIYAEVDVTDTYDIYSDNGIHSQLDIARIDDTNVFKITPKTGVKGNIEEPIVLKWGDNNSMSVWVNFKYQAPPLQPEKAIGNTEYVSPRDLPHEFASFEHKGVTYWMLIGHGDGTEEAIDFIDSTGWTYEGEGFTNFYFDFCTYDKELNKYFRINNDDLREEILARFNGTLKFSFLPVDVDDVHKATRYPAFYEGPAGWIASCKAVYDEDSGGTFYVQVEGTLAPETADGEPQELRTYATEGAYYTVIDHQTFTSVKDLNDFLESYLDEDVHGPQNDTERLDVTYTGEGDLYGQIYIPDGINIKLIGGTGENRARLHGSIVSDTSFMCLINNFHFIGAGGEGADPNDIPEKWPEDDAYNAGAYNYGLGGIMNGAPENCIFEGYYHGMHIDQNSEKVHFGGFNNIYQNNHTGFYMDYSYGQGGSVDNYWCVFEDNGTAIDIQDAPNYDSLFLGRFRINNGQFINNDVDIRNESGQILWMPMNYFVHDKQFTEGNDINHAEKKRTPIIAGTITSYGKELPATIPYPMAWDDSFNESQYYYPKSFTTENSLANRYPYVSFKQRSQELAQIMLLSDEPTEETTETVTVSSISGDEWVASMTVTEPTTANAAVYSRNMLRFRAAPQPTYTMYRIEQDGVVFVNLKSIQPEAFGEGQTWCDKSWVSVKVSLPNALEGEPNEVLASVKNGIVTFALAPGHANAEGRALYVIAPTAQATTKTADDAITVTITGEPDDGSTFTVEVPEDWKGETVIVTAPDGTETEVEVAEDGTVTFDVDQEGEYTLEKKKSGLSGLIGAIVGALGGIGNDMDFTDVAKNAWYHDDVAWAYSEGLMDGTGNGKFSPNMATSRAMIVTILWRLEGSPMGVEQSAFSDVVRSSWYGYAVDWAAAFGIVEGYDGKFAPNDAITREQLAAILYRYAKYKGYDVVNTRTDLGSFTDADKVSDWALAPMQWAVGNGLINGTNDALNCGGTATRAQTAAILHRFFG